MVLVVVFDELFEIGELFGVQDKGFGVDAGFEGVHGRGGLACDRGGAGGTLGVAAIRFNLTQSGHKLPSGYRTGSGELEANRGNWFEMTEKCFEFGRDWVCWVFGCGGAGVLPGVEVR